MKKIGFLGFLFVFGLLTFLRYLMPVCLVYHFYMVRHFSLTLSLFHFPLVPLSTHQ